MNADNRRILIVDDNIDIHDDFRKILLPRVSKHKLKNIGLVNGIVNRENTEESELLARHYIIDDAYQGEEALVMIDEAEKANKPYAVIFMDIRMPPGMDGIQTVQQIWKKYPNTEVVLCTAYSDYTWNELVNFFGETDHLLFIKKPFDKVAVKQTTLALTQKWHLARKNRRYMEELEEKVEQRTRDLSTANRKLQEKNYQIINFTQMITHDLKTPLASIIGTLDLLQDELPNLSESSQKLIKVSDEATQYMEALIEELLDIARLDMNEAEINKTEVNARAISENVITKFYEKIRKKNIVIVNSLTHTVRADVRAMSKIFMNLIGNAINYIGDSEQPKIILESSTNKKGYLFIVKDNGIGIPQASQEKIFDKFYRGQNTSDIKGSGLGLAIVKGLIMAHNGDIWLQSQIGIGTTFTFSIPYE